MTAVPKELLQGEISIAKLPTDPEAVAWNTLLGLAMLMAFATMLRLP